MSLYKILMLDSNFLTRINSAMTLQSLFWLFPISFMVHDFEEIIIVETWMKRNSIKVKNSAPRLLQKRMEAMFDIRADRFAFVVALEFIIFIPATWLAAEKGNYLFFVGFNSILALHVISHLGNSLILRRYTPGIATALFVTLPYSLYLFYRLFTAHIISPVILIKSLPIGIMLLPLVIGGHSLAAKILK